MEISTETQATAGVILLTVLFVEWGGYVVLRMSRGHTQATPFQVTFARAGHGHAAVLLVFALVGLILADSTDVTGIWRLVARNGIWIAAILFPAGFFFASAGKGRDSANRWILLVYVGAVVLAMGVVGLGAALLTAGS